MTEAHGTIVSLQLCPGHRKEMVPVDEAEAVENLGLRNDRHALPDSARQVLLIEQETLDELNLKPGDVKENITTRGISLMALVARARLKIGTEVVLEITKACSPCHRMEELRSGLSGELVGRRGMLARVVKHGKIRRGDVVELISR